MTPGRVYGGEGRIASAAGTGGATAGRGSNVKWDGKIRLEQSVFWRYVIHYINFRSMMMLRTQGARRNAGLVVAGLGGSLFMGLPALAADVLPAKAGPSYVRTCTMKTGEEEFKGYYIPGTDTCLRIGGYAWAEGYFNTFSNYPNDFDKTYTIATGAVIVDARTNTEYGVLRSYFESRFKWRTS